MSGWRSAAVGVLIWMAVTPAAASPTLWRSHFSALSEDYCELIAAQGRARPGRTHVL
jgi:hypothetical protein